MAGTATDWNVLKTASRAGQLWADLAIPGAGARLTLHTDGTPDSTANPNAKHLGTTAEGAQFLVKPGYENYFSNEFSAPLITRVGDVEAVISATLQQVMDLEIAALLLPGVGTYGSGSGYEQVSIGRAEITYTSIALIFPLEEDVTKYGVFHLYRASNDQGLAVDIANKKLAGAPVAFRGKDITTRAAIDTTGKIWKQVAA